VTDEAPTSAADLREQLRGRGFRMTPQRQLVLDAVHDLGHATPDEVLTRVRSVADGVNISTVYRTLELLEELGLVRHAHLGSGSPTWHPAEHAAHLHLVCHSCGAVTEAELDLADGLVGSLEAAHGFTTDMEHFAIYGTCAGCAGSA
jgi:Fur family transcriptional regulator, ferric uptake regulator